MGKNKIDLKQYKNKGSTIFTGRPQGKAVREKLDLDTLDKNNSKVVFVIPDNTTSFNPSFYLGLLFKSYENLGTDGVDNKYSFEIVDKNEDTRKVLLSNLEDGKRYAINSLDPKSGLRSLFSRKDK